MKKPIVVIFIGLLVLGVIGLFVYTKNNELSGAGLESAANSTDTAASTVLSQDQSLVPPPVSVADPQTETVSADTRSYTNKRLHFSLQYPNDLTVKEYTEVGDAFTITFSNEDESHAFQIYATPYSAKQISPERFKLDEPSGVRDQPIDVMIDNIRGTMFFGRNGILGDTREVWFIRGGYLYEVTTYKELDTWLAGVMKTWKFTK